MDVNNLIGEDLSDIEYFLLISILKWNKHEYGPVEYKYVHTMFNRISLLFMIILLRVKALEVIVKAISKLDKYK